MLRENGAAAAALAVGLAADEEFRNRLLDAAGHAVSAQRRARGLVGILAAATRLVADEQLRSEVVEMTRDLQAAWARVERQRSHRLRTMLLLLGGAGGVAAAAAPPTPSGSKGPSRTLVRLSMGYRAAGAREAVGSAIGLDRRRVREDLVRFKQLLQAAGTETGAWRGDISAGSTQPAATAANA